MGNPIEICIHVSARSKTVSQKLLILTNKICRVENFTHQVRDIWQSSSLKFQKSKSVEKRVSDLKNIVEQRTDAFPASLTCFLYFSNSTEVIFFLQGLAHMKQKTFRKGTRFRWAMLQLKTFHSLLDPSENKSGAFCCDQLIASNEKQLRWRGLRHSVEQGGSS